MEIVQARAEANMKPVSVLDWSGPSDMGARSYAVRETRYPPMLRLDGTLPLRAGRQRPWSKGVFSTEQLDHRDEPRGLNLSFEIVQHIDEVASGA